MIIAFFAASIAILLIVFISTGVIKIPGISDTKSTTTTTIKPATTVIPTTTIRQANTTTGPTTTPQK